MNSTRGRENELVIRSPGNGEAPDNKDERDQLKHGLFWAGWGWCVEYPDAMNWAGDDPNEAFYDEELGDVDEDAYDEYLEEEFEAAAAILMSEDDIPKGSYILRGEGYSGKEVMTK